MDRPACQALREYVAREQPPDYLTRLRMMWDWDEEAFGELVELASACLREIEGDDVVPRHVASFFASYLHLLEGMMRNPQFVAHNRGERTLAEAERHFERRRSLLLRLVTWFTNGACPYAPEHMTVR